MALKRITLIVGHYGSGKTEFSVNHVINLKKQYDKVAILDMDIANPYFRSRERQEFLEDMGITIHFNSMVVADVGGDNAGARVLNQFKKYFVDESDCEMLIVVNANRPETDTLEGALYHIQTIQAETGLKVKGLISNTHLLRETKVEDILKGYQLCRDISRETGIPITYTTCVEKLVPELEKAKAEQGLDDMVIYPIKLYMRPTWLDRK
ncbi:MAG: ATP-binding protein [Firmicutes bacterium]|nr:ATP-binding protein [Bacillota bacterium]